MLSRLPEFVLAAGIALAALAVLALMAVGLVVWLAGGHRRSPGGGTQATAAPRSP